MTSLKYNAPAELDLNDVPVVRERDLALVMRVAIDNERALVLTRGSTPEDKHVIERAFWNEFDGSTAQGVVTLIRFWCLVEAFATKRFRAMLLNRGFELISPAVAAASKLRLNLNWGFNPQRLFWAMNEVSASPQNVTKLQPKKLLAIPAKKLAA